MQSEEPVIIQSLEDHLAEYGHTTVGQDIAAAILVIRDLHQKAALSAAEPVATVAEMGAGGMRVLMPHPPGSADHLPIGTKLYAAPPAPSVSMSAFPDELQQLLDLLKNMPAVDRGYSWELRNSRGHEEIRAYGENAKTFKFVIDNRDALISALSAQVKDVADDAPRPELYDGDAFMADGEIPMTAAENVLAWLLIEKIGVPDDVGYSPNQAQEIIVRRLELARELEQIDGMLDEGQGDDQGHPIMPDSTKGMTTYAKVEACLHLLERRRDALPAAPAKQEG